MAEQSLIELTIEELGAAGDGVAHQGGVRYFIPDCLPGDRVRARITGRRGDGFAARTVERLAEGPHRGPPACRHFNDCGGCVAQHLDDVIYASWKRQRVIDALARRGLDGVAVAPMTRTPAGERRRATLHVLRRKHDAVIGFQARASHRIVEIGECPVLEPSLVALLAPLGELFAGLLEPGGRAEVLVTLAGSGIDLLIRAPGLPDLDQRESLFAFAEARDVARIAWRAPGDDQPELIVQRRPVRVDFAGVAVDLPPGGFLQPSAAGEAALVAFVMAATAGARHVADLYAGCGALSFPMTRFARVHAVEGGAAMTAAIDGAAARAGLTGRITSETRDLDRRPLLARECDRFDAVVFDPPRAGAKRQAEALAASRVPLVVALSCNPASFARDARILTDGGYAIDRVQPIDQFLWSAHVETAAIFRRESLRNQRSAKRGL